MKKIILFVVLIILYCFSAFAQMMPPSFEESAGEPVKYIGDRQTDKHFYDGKIPHAVGIHSRQIFRANRSFPPEGGMYGWTYSHAPNICYWNNQFYVQYLSCEKEEHNPPARTLIITSQDGRFWSEPEIVFPVYYLPEIKTKEYGYIPKGMASVMHQRMGFYTASNGRLLTIGFYSYCATPRHSPNLGQGLGRVVREVYKNGTYGPIYFIRYNRHAGWNESNTNYPFYTESSNKGFVEACRELLNNKLVTLQWWEMDRAKDGFYTIDPGDKQIKALSFYHRPDNIAVALWKYNYTALSPDDGNTWSEIVKSPTLMTCAAKLWGQKMDDGNYSLVYNHSATNRNRFPMIIITGRDGHSFDNMLCVNGEVAPTRYQGIHKNIGTQYIRGITEGNGNPPGDHEWIVYSMNKEDIWISRINVPVIGNVNKHVDQSFNSLNDESKLAMWNLYITQWAPVSISYDPENPNNKVLSLRDEEPYDYAKAERVIPSSKKLNVEMKVYSKKITHSHGILDIEVHDKYGVRPMKVRWEPEWLMLDRGKLEITPVPVVTNRWYHIRLELDCTKQQYNLYVDNKLVSKNIPFADKVESLERIVLRTGPWRNDVRPFIVEGVPGNPGLYIEDLPGADYKVPSSIYLIDDVKTYEF
ncbi:hypothetical protein ACFLS9_09595 [Bacteroidota bacterium]